MKNLDRMADCLGDEDMAKLIDLYEEEEILYNYRFKENHDRDRARESLLTISWAMGKNWAFLIVCVSYLMPRPSFLNWRHNQGTHAP